jgi:TPR repeat protein
VRLVSRVAGRWRRWTIGAAVLATAFAIGWGVRHARDRSLAAQARAALPLYAHGGNVVRVGGAIELFREACDRGVPDGCAGLGYAASRGLVVDADPIAGRRLLERACAGGSAGACAHLGQEQATGGSGVERDPAHARELFARAADAYRDTCVAGETLACVGYGTLLARGDGVPKDAGRAVGLFRSACDRGDLLGCCDLGAMYLDGDGVSRDAERGAALFRRACDGGEPLGCFLLARRYQDGNGVAPDARRAEQLHQRACAAGELFACVFLGMMYEEGAGVPRNLARARDVYAQACAGGERVGCVHQRRITAPPAR